MVAVHAVMTANGDGSKDVWATEFGAPTNGPGALATYANRNYAQHPDHVDTDLQSRTVDAGIAAAKQLPWLRMLLWYSVAGPRHRQRQQRHLLRAAEPRRDGQARLRALAGSGSVADVLTVEPCCAAPSRGPASQSTPWAKKHTSDTTKLTSPNVSSCGQLVRCVSCSTSVCGCTSATRAM